MRRFAHLVLLTLVGVCSGEAEDRPHGFVAFGFGGLETMPVNEAVDLLMNLGYAGVVPEGRDASDLARFEQYLDRSELEEDGFTVPAYYLNHKIYNDGYDDSVHREVIDLLAARGGGTIWMAVRAVKKQSDPVDYERVNDFIKGVFEYASGVDGDGNYRNVSIVFYPHVNNAYQSTIEALPLIEEINDPRFTVSINLVHEYHAGRSDQTSLMDSFDQARGRVGAIILCGIKTSGEFSILSLEDSEHDLKPFMRLVRDSEYAGPVGFINFAIPEDANDGVDYPEEYLAGSLTEWESLSNEIALFQKPERPFTVSSAIADGGLDLKWNSRMGKFYHLFSSTDLVHWAPHNDGANPYVNIPTSGVGTNELTQIPLQSDQHFFRIVEDVLRWTPILNHGEQKLRWKSGLVRAAVWLSGLGYGLRSHGNSSHRLAPKSSPSGAPFLHYREAGFGAPGGLDFGRRPPPVANSARRSIQMSVSNQSQKVLSAAMSAHDGAAAPNSLE